MLRRRPDLCVLLIPEGPDRERVHEALQRAAQWVGGVPVQTPHVTVAYLYDVTPDGQAAYARCIAPLAQATPPMPVTATDVITQGPLLGGSPVIMFAVQRTPALEALYDGLADAARHMNLLCNPGPDYRQGGCGEPRPVSAAAWVPHLTALEDVPGAPADLAPLLRPLAPDLGFCARSLWLSHRNQDGEWELGQRLALTPSRSAIVGGSDAHIRTAGHPARAG